MSLVDRTNEKIPLSQHAPQESADWSGLPGWNGYSIPTGTDTSGVTATTLTPAHLDVDADGDSSYDPSAWVNLSWIDAEHDSDTIKLTYGEAALLHDRLGRILGIVKPPKNRYRVVQRASINCGVGDLVRSYWNNSGAVWKVEAVNSAGSAWAMSLQVRSITSGRTDTRIANQMNVVEEVAQ